MYDSFDNTYQVKKNAKLSQSQADTLVMATTVTLISETRSCAFLLVSERNGLQHSLDVDGGGGLSVASSCLCANGTCPKSRSKDTDA